MKKVTAIIILSFCLRRAQAAASFRKTTKVPPQKNIRRRQFEDVSRITADATLNSSNSISTRSRYPYSRQQLHPRKKLVYFDKPKLRGEFHRWGAILYPPLLGLPLFFRSLPANRKAALLFSLAVEGIMVVSATLHIFPWQNEVYYHLARKADFAMIFVGIAMFYSSIGKLLLGSEAIFTSIIEPMVWACAAVGVLAKCFRPDADPWLNAGIFLMQGWAILPCLQTLFRTCSFAEAAGLFMGGIFITLGAAAYSVRWPEGHWRINPDIFGPHEMFHVGTLFMFVSFWFTMWIRVVR